MKLVLFQPLFQLVTCREFKVSWGRTKHRIKYLPYLTEISFEFKNPIFRHIKELEKLFILLYWCFMCFAFLSLSFSWRYPRVNRLCLNYPTIVFVFLPWGMAFSNRVATPFSSIFDTCRVQRSLSILMNWTISGSPYNDFKKGQIFTEYHSFYGHVISYHGSNQCLI